MRTADRDEEPAPASPVLAGPPIALAETCRVGGGAIPLWEWHRARLLAGGCPTALLEKVEREVGAAIARYPGERTSRLRLHVEIGTDGTVEVEIARALSSLDVVGGPVIAFVRCTELPSMPSLPPHAAKPADRSWWDAAARVARRRGAHQAVIVDPDGLILDGSSASVWAVIANRLVTPPGPPAIEGVARQVVLERAAGLGLEATVGPVRRSDIEHAEEVLLTNAFGGAVPARGRGGPVSDTVRELFATAFGTAHKAEAGV